MRPHVLSALYEANASLQHWIECGEYLDDVAVEIERITQDIDALRVDIERGGFCEFERMKLRSLSSRCRKSAEHGGYGRHILLYMSLLAGAV